jgi:mitochondrial fission protein ELM1
VGALSNIKAKIEQGEKELRKNYPEITRFIAVIIGGNTKNYQFIDDNAHSLSSILSKIANNHSIPLFISFSRRTPDSAKQIIRERLPLPNIIYDPQENKPNPYFGMLSSAEYIISTADSISMCSEAASSGKPLYIFCPDNFKSRKHRSFIKQLIDRAIARNLDSSIELLETYSYQPLYEVQKISDLIKSAILEIA